MRRERSKPVTFLPQVVLNALRAAATATSMSFSEPIHNTEPEDVQSDLVQQVHVTQIVDTPVDRSSAQI